MIRPNLLYSVNVSFTDKSMDHTSPIDKLLVTFLPNRKSMKDRGSISHITKVLPSES